MIRAVLASEGSASYVGGSAELTPSLTPDDAASNGAGAVNSVTPTVAVVVPVYRNVFSAAEELSLRSLRHHLSGFPLMLVAPESCPVSVPDFSVMRFPDRHFTSRNRYSELLVSSRFYEAFASYTYILIFQPDCLVFANQLESWCALGYDYVGAPWVRRNDAGELEFTGVGNGGFSLRRVQACLAVLAARDRAKRWTDPAASVSRLVQWTLRNAGRGLHAVLRGDRQSLAVRSRNAIHQAMLEARPELQNEDLFWSRADSILPGFRIAPADIAVRFAFEAEPRFCFDRNQGQLPFGCHQWEQYDLPFWEPHLGRALGTGSVGKLE